jgi:formate/nitrite transporter
MILQNFADLIMTAFVKPTDNLENMEKFETLDSNMPIATPQIDAYPPREIAQRAEQLGIAKAKLEWMTLLPLAILAGAFISMGALFFLVVVTQSELGFGITRLVGGLAFSMGLILVVIAGAELFTGNNLIAMSWASRQISTTDVLRNWTWVYLGNVIGCLITVGLAIAAGVPQLGEGAVGTTAINVAIAKSQLGFAEVFARGILCNALVCMAVWLALGGRSVTDKILAIIFPVTAFVTLGLEHSIANWFFLPLGMAIDPSQTILLGSVANNLLASTLGNILGGTCLVAGVYWLAYLRNPQAN